MGKAEEITALGDQERIEQLYPRDPTPWQYGDTLTFAGMRDLHEFENDMPAYIDNSVSQESWDTRPRIDTIVRQSIARQKKLKFQGTIGDITLVPVPDPVRVLHDWQTPIMNIEGKTSNPLGDTNQQIRELFIGFRFVAKAFSTGRGQIATLHSTIVYAPRLYNSTGHKKSYVNSPHGLRRAMGQPIPSSPDAFEQLVNESIVTSQAVEESDLRHTIVKGFTQ